MNAYTVKFPEDVAQKLEQLAEQRDSSTAALVVKAVRELLAREEADTENLLQGMAEAERGEFATEEEVKAVFRQYNPHPRFL
jgi:predicted transcriptional regulator